MSTKTVAEKLLIKPDSTLWSSHMPRLDLIGPLPARVCVVDELDEASTALIFADDAESLRAILDTHRGRLTQPRAFWVAYPKGNRADINRDSLWPMLTEYGMRPIAQVAVNEVWSALRFRPLSEGEAPFTGGR